MQLVFNAQLTLVLVVAVACFISIALSLWKMFDVLERLLRNIKHLVDLFEDKEPEK